MEKENKPLSEKETEADCFNQLVGYFFYADDVKQKVKEAYLEIEEIMGTFDGISFMDLQRIFKDKFGFKL
ncbi:MAG: hypothetical protein ACTSQH_00090 [Candidatus Hodarchaeales archaeon]